MDKRLKLAKKLARKKIKMQKKMGLAPSERLATSPRIASRVHRLGRSEPVVPLLVAGSKRKLH